MPRLTGRARIFAMCVTRIFIDIEEAMKIRTILCQKIVNNRIFILNKLKILFISGFRRVTPSEKIKFGFPDQRKLLQF